MLREGRGATSPYVMAFLSPDGSVHLRFRTARGEVPNELLYKGPASWLKVGRIGDVFTGYASVDSKTWSAIGNAKLVMKHDLLAGLISTSRDNKEANLARFGDVDVTRTDAAFDGEAAPLPGVVQAERFDAGGTGYTFSAEIGAAGPDGRPNLRQSRHRGKRSRVLLEGTETRTLYSTTPSLSLRMEIMLSPCGQLQHELVALYTSTSTRSLYPGRFRFPPPAATISGER